MEVSPTSCSDISGSSNVKQGHASVCKTAESESSNKFINGNNNRDIDNTEEQHQTMPDQDFHAMNIEDNSNSLTEDSKESQNCDPHNHKSSAQTPSSTKSDSSTGIENSHAASSNMSNCTSNSNEVEAETPRSSDVNSNNKSDIEKDNVDSVTETGEGNEEALEDFVIPVPTLPKSAPCADVKPKSSNGHGPRFGQQKKRPPLQRRPTPVKIETPAKLLNERMKMAKRENSFLEEEEEED